MDGTFKGKEVLSKEQTMQAREMMIKKKMSAVEICMRLHVGEATLYRSFKRWGLTKGRGK